MRRAALFSLALVAAWSAASARATVILTTEHADLSAAYVGGELELEIHDEDNDIEYEPGEALFYVGPSGKTTQPAGPEWEFIGAGPGGDVWVIPQVQDPTLPFIGFGAEEVDPGTFASYLELDPRAGGVGEWLRYALKDVRGPGQFSVWTNSGLSTTVWMSTADGVGADDLFFQLAGNHTDANFGFTAPGVYEIDLDVSAYLGPGETNLISSEVATYRFGVEMVPEPSSSLLLAVGGVTWGLFVWRKRRVRCAA